MNRSPKAQANPLRPSRRALLRTSVGAALGAAGLAAAPGAAWAGTPQARSGRGDRAITGTRIRNLTGPAETGRFAAPWTDLGIPVKCPNGSLLYVCGDTFDGGGVGGPDWRSPIGLRSSSSDLNNLVIDGSVGGDHAVGLVPEGHEGGTTAIPSDVFTIGDTMYMHLMRGVIYQTHHSDFWRSTDNGETWEYLCQWPGNALGGQFQQKTYAVADDGWCYVLSTVFNREIVSGLLLHRVRHESVGDPAAYEPWGYDGQWGWGVPASTITGARRWGEICFRALGGKYAFTYLHHQPNEISLRAQVFDTPTSNLFETPEQTMILPTLPGNENGNLVASPYGGWIFPGSSYDNFHIAVSQWFDNQNYRVMQYRINGLAA
ncbi:DUF4185 domain-containing protein [Streptomyces sp. NPDC005438]|uniref:DUF4185 domain-containing protein n=1 Tax=Streptomyces sp. NPDC005438 TaxID=3156880 RepID=UPI0033B06E74